MKRSSEDQSLTKKFSKNDFLKFIKAGVGGVALGTMIGEGGKYVREFLGHNKSFEMANNICGSIVAAEVSGDVTSELRARKAALSWLFAETAMVVAPYVGYDTASHALRHYMYGDGQVMDLSEDMQHLAGDKVFWNQTFAKAFTQILKSDLRVTFADTESRFNSVLRYFISQLAKGVKFQTQTPKEGVSEKIGLFYALGTSEYQLKVDKAEVVTTSDEKIVLETENTSLKMRDVYDWVEGDFNPGIVYLSRITGLVIDEAFNSLGLDRIVRTILLSTGISEWQRQLMYDNYLEARARIGSNVSSLMVDIARGVEKEVMGDQGAGHYNYDLSLLVEYGAKPFPMEATINYDGNKIEMPFE
jgi:hypothetical protein